MGIEIRIAASGVVHVETSRSYTECGEEGEKRSFDFFDGDFKSYIGDALALALTRRKEEADAPIPAEPDMDLTEVAEPLLNVRSASGLTPRDPEKKVVTVVPIAPSKPLPEPKKGQF